MIENRATKRLDTKKNALANDFQDMKIMFEPLTPLELTNSHLNQVKREDKTPNLSKKNA